jgi:hypothetical protein
MGLFQEGLNILGDPVHQTSLHISICWTHTSFARFLTSSDDSAPSYFSVRECIGSNFPRAPPHDLPSATPKCCSRNCRSTVSGGLGSGWYWWIWSACILVIVYDLRYRGIPSNLLASDRSRRSHRTWYLLMICPERSLAK